jgi:hypothetical protein
LTSNSAAPIRPWTTLALATLALSLSLLGCAPRFLAHNFTTEYQARTRVVALAPIANLTSNPEGARAGQAIREAIFQELVRRQDRYTVTIQDIAETDRRIQDSGMSHSTAARLPSTEFCRLAGVDAVMSGSVTRFDKKGVAGQIASAILSSSATGSEVRADVAIYDGTDGKMTFQHDIKKKGGFLSSPDALRKSVGATVAGKFPYKRRAR